MKLLSAEQLAAKLGIQASWIKRRGRQNARLFVRIPCIKIGRLRLYNEDDVLESLHHAVNRKGQRYTITSGSAQAGDEEQA